MQHRKFSRVTLAFASHPIRPSSRANPPQTPVRFSGTNAMLASGTDYRPAAVV